MEEQTWLTRFHMTEAIQTLKFNPSEMKWIDFDLDLLLKVDTSNANSDEPSGRSSILVNTHFALESITRAFASTMNHNAEALMEAAKLDPNRDASQLPWLPWPDRRIEGEDVAPFSYPAPGFDIEKPLAGQHIDEVNSVFGLVKLKPNLVFMTETELKYPFLMKDAAARFGTPIVILGVVSAGFDEGSLFHWFRARASVIALAISLLGPAGKGIDVAVNSYQLHATIEKELQFHAPAVQFSGYRYSGAELDKLGIQAFDYEEAGISKAEKAHRIANCELAFRVMLRTDISIDGEVGPDFKAHLQRVARLKGCTATIKDKFLRAELLNAIHPPFKPW